MNIGFDKPSSCPKCGGRLKSWTELDEDEQFIAERMPNSAKWPIEKRKRHRFCTRCWFEDRSVKGNA